MKSTHLKLRVDPNGYRAVLLRQQDPKFVYYREKILERDSNNCYFCSFQSHKHIQIVNIDGDYNNNKLSNLGIACPLCAQCLFLQATNDFTGGTLITCPDIDQKSLNAQFHILFCTMYIHSEQEVAARQIYRAFKFRSDDIVEQLGEEFADPDIISTLCMQNDIQPAQSETIFEHLRFLPDFNGAEKYLKDWVKDALDQPTSSAELSSTP